MKYSKIFITISCLFFLSNCVFAQTWKDVSMENNKTVFIDVDSVNSHNNSIYYNVKYLDKGGFEEISTVQSRGNKAGLISTCKYTDYLKDKSCANSLTTSTLSVLDDISVKSFLYNANEIAKLTFFKKVHNISTIHKLKEDQEYLSKIFRMYRKRISEVWRKIIKDKSISNRVVILITFDKKGKLISCLIVKSGGDEANEAAIKAVRQVGNLGDLTKDLHNEYIDIQFTFADWNNYNDDNDKYIYYDHSYTYNRKNLGI